jgi:diaminohydroxyphosphoribosylaminopyrimidine deaminase / 5-amino-6-(5-phosphoribosylamino)uracil reductase
MERASEAGSQDDQRLMRRALELARRGLGLASPNPMVGAVVLADGRVVGEGWHEGPGTPHAEVRALEAAGERARGATLYVTLEPCSHWGRTPACAPRVAEAGIARVVVGALDPNPIVDGAGVRHLREAGLSVEVGELETDARELIAGFARHVRTGLPFVTLKMAASLDGKVAARDGSSRWITGELARRDAHLLRAASDAIVVGAGTAAADNPSLGVRLDGYRGRQPLRVILDAVGRLPGPPHAEGPHGPTVMAGGPSLPPPTRDAWERSGAEVLVIDETDGDGMLSLPALMAALGKRAIQNVLIEGGPAVAWSAVESGIVDRFVLYLAPKLIGGREAPGILGGDGVRSVGDALPVEIVRVERLGDDIKVVADVHRDR